MKRHTFVTRSVSDLIVVFCLLVLLIPLSSCDSGNDRDDQGPSSEEPEQLVIGPEFDPAEVVPAWQHLYSARHWGSVVHNGRTAFFWGESEGGLHSPERLFGVFIDESQSEKDLALSRTEILAAKDHIVPLMLTSTDENFVIFYGQYESTYPNTGKILHIYRLVLDGGLGVVEKILFHTVVRTEIIVDEYDYYIPSFGPGPLMKWLGACYLVIWREERHPSGGNNLSSLWGQRLSAAGDPIDTEPGELVSVPEGYYLYSWALTTDDQRSLLAWSAGSIDASPHTSLWGNRLSDSGDFLDGTGFFIATEDSIDSFSSAVDDSHYCLTWQGKNRNSGVYITFGGEIDDPGVFVLSDEWVQNPNHEFAPLVVARQHGFFVIQQQGNSISVHFPPGSDTSYTDFVLFPRDERYSTTDILAVTPESGVSDLEFKIVWRDVGALQAYYSFALQFRERQFTLAGDIGSEHTLAAPPNETRTGGLCFREKNIAVSWSDDRVYFPEDTDIFGQLVDANSQPLFDHDSVLSSQQYKAEFGPKIISNGDTYCLTFVTFSEAGHFYSFGRTIVILDGQMQVLATKYRAAYDYRSPDGPFEIEPDGDNSYVLVSGEAGFLTARWIDDAGQISDPPLLLEEDNNIRSRFSYNVRSTSAGDRFLVVYEDDHRIVGRFFTHTTVGDEFSLIDNSRSLILDELACSDGDEIILTAWIVDSLPERTVQMRRMQHDGTILDGEPVTLAQTPQGNNIRVVWNGRCFLLVWQERFDESETERTELKAMRILENGTILDQNPILIHTSLDRIESLNPCISADSAGSYAIAYESMDETLPLPTRRVKIRKIETH